MSCSEGTGANLSDYLPEIREILVGKTYEEAREECRKGGWRIRAVLMNGEPTVCTRDLVMTRINVVVDKDIVTEVRHLG